LTFPRLEAPSSCTNPAAPTVDAADGEEVSMRQRASLEEQVLAVLKRALAEGSVEAAEHLLRAVETLCGDECPGSTRASAYVALAEATFRAPDPPPGGDTDA